MSPKPWENAEGYADPTAYNAIKKVSAEGHEALDAKVNTLIQGPQVYHCGKRL